MKLKETGNSLNTSVDGTKPKIKKKKKKVSQQEGGTGGEAGAGGATTPKEKKPKIKKEKRTKEELVMLDDSDDNDDDCSAVKCLKPIGKLLYFLFWFYIKITSFALRSLVSASNLPHFCGFPQFCPFPLISACQTETRGSRLEEKISPSSPVDLRIFRHH